MRSFEELSRRISSSVSDALVRVSYLTYLSCGFSLQQRRFCFSSTNLETGTDETVVGRNGLCHV